MEEEILEFKEPTAGNANPDEMDDEYFDGLEDDQQNEDLKRLQEMTEIDKDYSDCEDEDEEKTNNKEELTVDSSLSNVNEKNSSTRYKDFELALSDWSWEYTQPQRLLAAASLIRVTSTLIARLNKLITANELTSAHKQCSEAGAIAFRNARIVGATVVGASRRLEALRSAGPFAVVIEEACEVIEPTLVSVLAVNTLKKLEMIGDHRQLPAFVQQCWFNFETTLPSIKTSLFERLISGQVKTRFHQSKNKDNRGAILPYTVLDEQRRMRTSIADITRPDYVDLVQIKGFYLCFNKV